MLNVLTEHQISVYGTLFYKAFILNCVKRQYINFNAEFFNRERGTKFNNGTPEIHASSIGMAKSALEAINGCNLFGDKGASWSVVSEI